MNLHKTARAIALEINAKLTDRYIDENRLEIEYPKLSQEDREKIEIQLKRISDLHWKYHYRLANPGKLVKKGQGRPAETRTGSFLNAQDANTMARLWRKRFYAECKEGTFMDIDGLKITTNAPIAKLRTWLNHPALGGGQGGIVDENGDRIA